MDITLDHEDRSPSTRNCHFNCGSQLFECHTSSEYVVQTDVIGCTISESRRRTLVSSGEREATSEGLGGAFIGGTGDEGVAMGAFGMVSAFTSSSGAMASVHSCMDEQPKFRWECLPLKLIVNNDMIF